MSGGFTIFSGLMGTAGALPANLVEWRAFLGTTMQTQIAMNKFGFRAYDQLAKRRALAIKYPESYLDAKRTRIMGGHIPAGVDGSAGYAEILYGGTPDTDIDGVAGEVAKLYKDTIAKVYRAGGDEATATKWATQVAEGVKASGLALVEVEYPPLIDDVSERNLLMNTLGTVGGRIAFGEPSTKALVRKK